MILAANLLELKAITLRFDPMFIWSSGIKSPIYTDIRILMGCSHMRKIVLTYFTSHFHREEVKGIAAVATAGIYWGTLLADFYEKPLVYVRSSEKKHGRENKVEGLIEEGREYTVIDDVCSTGKSTINAVRAIRDKGGIVKKCTAVFSYNLTEASENFAEAEVSFFSLTDLEELLFVALRLGSITSEQKEKVLYWRNFGRHEKGG